MADWPVVNIDRGPGETIERRLLVAVYRSSRVIYRENRRSYFKDTEIGFETPGLGRVFSNEESFDLSTFPYK